MTTTPDPTDAAACPRCTSGGGCISLGKDLHRILFEDFAPESPDQWLTYQNDLLKQCPHCEAVWLEQYWEYDTRERVFEEFGVRNYARTLMSQADLDEMDAALAAGVLMPQNRFRR